MSRFQPGQVWQYNTRPGEESSRITIAKVEAHPKLGASWEGFVIEQVIRQVGAQPNECFFWATYAGAELDLLIVRGRRLVWLRWRGSAGRGWSGQVITSP